ncbi:hypothetical protein KBZ21_08085 [Streptomyces sp. A73]|uniref:hypothetical protein n=1 Tax=Streptomyces TaxID=1883 RepID=UPI000C18C23F|nr:MULTISPECIES: hypothetical protein [unclassified Streptomyces]MBQ0868044.1 hypothetical protein [Streptomyces sp. RK75]MBQ1121697.1 hypothetical protein [Streptomyces sp. B15]MBQ1158105.1 hypothetical protein [Streptomyces sp. A73]
MDVRGAVYVVLRGPAEKRDRALGTLKKAGIFAEKSVRGSEVIEAFFYGGDERPSPRFMDACAAHVAKAAIGTDFAVAETGTISSAAASRKLAYNRRTGEWLGAFIDTQAPERSRSETLDHLARERGVDVADIELRDPPKFQPPVA